MASLDAARCFCAECRSSGKAPAETHVATCVRIQQTHADSGCDAVLYENFLAMHPHVPSEGKDIHESKSLSVHLMLEEARKLTSSREILLWMTPSEAPKALQASECSELLDPMRASCWIFAQH